MKIALLASNPRLYSNKRLMEEAEKRGHEITFLQLEKCYMSITEQVPSIHAHTGDIITSIDAIIPRIKPAATFYGTAILRHFELMGATCLNGSVPIARSRDKLRSLQLLARKGIRMPATGFANTPADSRDLVKMVGGAPLVIKLLESTQGAGVVLAETNNAAESVITAFKRLKANFLVQEFIEESQGEDLRCFVIGNRVIASIKRKAADGDFRSNLHRGGAASDVKITPEEEKMAIQCANYLGLMVAGVDILRSDRGPMVLEVNSSPGLEGIENFTGKNVAGTMIEYLEKEASRKNPPLLNLFRHLPHKKKTPSASKVEGSGKTSG